MRYLVAIPVHNEEKYCCRVVNRVERYARHILVVNDGSTDRTPDLLAQFRHVAVINHPTNLGYGQALMTAFTYAQEKGFDYVLTMDCDEQHEPEAIPRFLAEAPNYDIVSGSRYLAESGENDAAPQERRSVNREVTRIINGITGYNLTDSFCGQKAYRAAAVARLNLTERGYAMPLELWIEAAAAGLTVKEIPVLRIYKDFSRRFGGDLDDAERRLRYYREVIERARRAAGLVSRCRCRCAGGCCS